ncbi:hypothetical protein LINPERHAP1_LOCUS15520 [Linum perenne]
MREKVREKGLSRALGGLGVSKVSVSGGVVSPDRSCRSLQIKDVRISIEMSDGRFGSVCRLSVSKGSSSHFIFLDRTLVFWLEVSVETEAVGLSPFRLRTSKDQGGWRSKRKSSLLPHLSSSFLGSDPFFGAHSASPEECSDVSSSDKNLGSSSEMVQRISVECQNSELSETSGLLSRELLCPPRSSCYFDGLKLDLNDYLLLISPSGQIGDGPILLLSKGLGPVFGPPTFPIFSRVIHLSGPAHYPSVFRGGQSLLLESEVLSQETTFDLPLNSSHVKILHSASSSASLSPSDSISPVSPLDPSLEDSHPVSLADSVLEAANLFGLELFGSRALGSLAAMDSFEAASARRSASVPQTRRDRELKRIGFSPEVIVTGTRKSRSKSSDPSSSIAI